MIKLVLLAIVLLIVGAGIVLFKSLPRAKRAIREKVRGWRKKMRAATVGRLDDIIEKHV